ncbi:MAG: hypothetical protein GKS07_10370 [Nitrosopumilus sp.]|nr:MAG: hypothetical protein GKS07_10370 [Nitrosopumilus sp.]
MAEWDIPNWISLIVEVGVAIFAVVISWKFYTKGKKQQEKIEKIETEQSDLIKEMKPILDKQEKIISAEKIRLDKKRVALRVHFNSYSLTLERLLEVLKSKRLSKNLDTLLPKLDDAVKNLNMLEDEHEDILDPDEKLYIDSMRDCITLLRAEVEQKVSLRQIGAIQDFLNVLSNKLRDNG